MCVYVCVCSVFFVCVRTCVFGCVKDGIYSHSSELYGTRSLCNPKAAWKRKKHDGRVKRLREVL